MPERAIRVTLLLIALAACSDPDRAPPAGTLDGGVTGPVRPPFPRPRLDGGAVDDGGGPSRDAGGLADASGPTPGCIAAPPGNVATLTQSGATVPFTLRTAFVNWDDTACDVPAILVGLTEGSCSPRVGTQLLFSLDRDAIDSSLLRVGANPVDPETGVADPVRVRFFAPDGSASPPVWGTCAGATGTIDVEDVDTVPGSRLRASFSLLLTDCRGAPSALPLDVTGSFDVVLSVPFESVCP